MYEQLELLLMFLFFCNGESFREEGDEHVDEDDWNCFFSFDSFEEEN